MLGPQIEFAFSNSTAPCDHACCFYTLAYVPGGILCTDCGLLLWQSIPEPPEQVGYLTADWAWHHRDGKAWTTQVGA